MPASCNKANFLVKKLNRIDPLLVICKSLEKRRTARVFLVTKEQVGLQKVLEGGLDASSDHNVLQSGERFLFTRSDDLHQKQVQLHYKVSLMVYKNPFRRK
jgi:hypothetical protein